MKLGKKMVDSVMNYQQFNNKQARPLKVALACLRDLN